MTKNLELNKEEAQVLINLINIAVKTVGLEGAEAGAYFAKKLTALFKEESASPVKDEVAKETE